MFNSFRVQILLVFGTVMLVTASGIIYTTNKDVGDAVVQIQKDSNHNIFKFIDDNIEDEYNRIVEYKVNEINNLKNTLKSQVSLSTIAYQAFLTETDKSTWKKIDSQWMKLIKDWFESSLRDKEIDWLIIDKSGNIILTSNPDFNKGNINSFLDMNDQSFEKKLVGSNLSQSGEFAVFHQYQSDKAKKDGDNRFLGYYMPVKNTDQVICAFIDLEKRIAKEENIKRQFLEMIGDKRVGQSGFVLIFDEKKDILGKPAKEAEGFELYKKNLPLWQKSINFSIDNGGLTGEALGGLQEVTIHGSEEHYVVHGDYFSGFGWYIAIILPKDELTAPAEKIIKKQFQLILLIFAFSLLISIFIISKMIKPLVFMTQQMQSVPEIDFTTEEDKNLIESLPVSLNNEIGKLAKAFFYMMTELDVNIKQLVQTTASNERMESELNVARDIQLGSLPTRFTFEPEHKELEIYAYLIPAREIGGDLYDFYFIDDDHFCFTLGDVAGKGVPAALFMVTAKKLIKNNALCQQDLSPAAIMTQLNEMLYQDNPNATFVTLFIGILNVRTGELRYANGGHVPPIFTGENDPGYKKDLSGPVVGVIPGVTYKDISISFQPGETIFLCTDGVTEAMNEEDKLFGDPRLLEEFTRIKDQPCKEVIDDILHEVKGHAGNAPQSDDIAMMMIRWGTEQTEKISGGKSN